MQATSEMIPYGREYTMNNILKKFANVINEKKNSDEMFDITTILTDKQSKKFQKLQVVMAKLFSADNLAEGLEKVADDNNLNEDEQMSILLIMKLVETMMSEMEGTEVSDVPNDGMYQ